MRIWIPPCYAAIELNGAAVSYLILDTVQLLGDIMDTLVSPAIWEDAADGHAVLAQSLFREYLVVMELYLWRPGGCPVVPLTYIYLGTTYCLWLQLLTEPRLGYIILISYYLIIFDYN